jgi:transposase
MTPDEKYAYARTFPVQVGVDTSKTFHVLVARGPDGRRSKAFRADVSRTGFDQADAHLVTLFPDVPRERMLVGLEFAGHHGFTFAHHLAARGYPVVNVLPSVTKKTKEIEDNSPLKTDAKDAALIAKLTGDGSFVRFPFLDEQYVTLRPARDRAAPPLV